MTAVVPRLITAGELAGLLQLPAPTEEQAAVIESGLEPSAVVAGAGSGKTETMAARVVWLVANRIVGPDELLGLTFTRKAAAELGSRIRRRLAQWRRVVEHDRPDDVEHLARLLASEPTVLTYAAYAGRLVAEQGLRLGAEPDARLLPPAVSWQLSDSVVRRWGGPLTEFKAISSLVHWVIAMAGQFADHLVEAADVEQFCELALTHFFALPLGPRVRSEIPTGTREYVDALVQRKALVPLVREFQRVKAAMVAVDFGDQMRLAAALAHLPEVAAQERGRYRAVLLDEYQDTGHAQIEMLRGLYGAGHPVTAVGDPFQSIYGWRGASAGNMGAFDTVFRLPDGRPARVYPLATSFRNDRAILHAANAVAALLRTHRITGPLRADRNAGPGTVACAFLETADDEAQWVARRLAAAWAALPDGGRTAAVLVRRRSQLPALADALQDAGLPVEIVGLGGLLTTPEVVDVVATLRVLGDHKPSAALMRLLTGARWRIGPRDLAVLRDRARRLVQPTGGAQPDVRAADSDTAEPEAFSLVEALDDLGPADRYSPAGFRRMSRLGEELRRLRRRLTAPLAELVAEVEHTIGVGIEVAARPDRANVGRVHLDRFLDVAADFAAEAGDASLRAFLSYLEAAEDEENGLEAGDVVVATERVQLLTIHGAKGLEWDLVAVPGMASGIFPGDPKGANWAKARHSLPGPLRGDRAELPDLDVSAAQSRKEIADLLRAHVHAVKGRHDEEERRLAYVAVTRARSTLLASGYAWDTTKEPRTPSIFLDDVRAACATSGGAGPDLWFEPLPDSVNPCTAEPRTARWPVDPLRTASGSTTRRAAVEHAAALVRDAASTTGDALPGMPTPPVAVRDPAVAVRVAQWRHDVDVLLAERDRLSRDRVVPVELPANLSVSQLVELRRDPQELARSLRRPLPRAPAPLARRGTAFHLWLEQRWQQQTLLDIDELPGAADEAADDGDFEQLRAAFEASAWAHRTPHEVEVPFEMTIGGVAVCGRMDAVFDDDPPGGGAAGRHSRWLVVDWKTGRKPTGQDASAVAVQLGAYRLAWARLSGIPDGELHRVRAAFHYVRTGETVEPDLPPDADGLRRLIEGR